MDPLDLNRLRRANEAAGLTESDLSAEPMTLLRDWLDAAVDSGLDEPNAMVVGTVGPDGAPSSRLVLCKGLDERGPVFFTNYNSRKARELASRPAVSLLFPWHPLGRQVRVEGQAEQVSAEESDEYFATRPRGAQLSAWASAQSDVVPSRDVLEQRVHELGGRYPDAVPRPSHWGGIRVEPRAVEFWQSRPDRLHDRLLFTREGTGWSVARLQP
jgi:pyridoxamine 5'-phosphate oxidase